MHHCYGLNVCVPQSSHAEILTSTVMVLGGGAFGRRLGYEDGARIGGISALIEEVPESSLPASTTWGSSEEVSDCEPGPCPSPGRESGICWHLELGLLGLQNHEKQTVIFSVSKSKQPKWTEITSVLPFLSQYIPNLPYLFKIAAKCSLIWIYQRTFMSLADQWTFW